MSIRFQVTHKARTSRCYTAQDNDCEDQGPNLEDPEGDLEPLEDSRIRVRPHVSDMLTLFLSLSSGFSRIVGYARRATMPILDEGQENRTLIKESSLLNLAKSSVPEVRLGA
jgi:hypothetical protein